MTAKQMPQVPPAERVQSTYKQLSQAATLLNSASDELGKAISLLDAALKKLHLGVSAWVTLSSSEEPSGIWWTRDVGYAKVGDRWGIALRRAEGDYAIPEHESEEKWLFNDGPRWMRSEASKKIPELLEALLKETQNKTKELKDRSTLVYELAAAVESVASEVQPAEEGTNASPS
jgi:hypothetical protein